MEQPTRPSMAQTTSSARTESNDRSDVKTWGRPQQHAVHHAEDGDGGADAQRQRQDGDGGEAGAAPQRTDHLPDVFAADREPFEPSSPWMLAPQHATVRSSKTAQLVSRAVAMETTLGVCPRPMPITFWGSFEPPPKLPRPSWP